MKFKTIRLDEDPRTGTTVDSDISIQEFLGKTRVGGVKGSESNQTKKRRNILHHSHLSLRRDRNSVETHELGRLTE